MSTTMCSHVLMLLIQTESKLQIHQSNEMERELYLKKTPKTWHFELKHYNIYRYVIMYMVVNRVSGGQFHFNSES